MAELKSTLMKGLKGAALGESTGRRCGGCGSTAVGRRGQG
jgi:predicted  nucleic acid-binding Zn-ribbon protein